MDAVSQKEISFVKLPHPIVLSDLKVTTENEALINAITKKKRKTASA